MSDKKKKQGNFDTWDDMPLDEFEKRVETARKLVADFKKQMGETLPGLVTLTAEQRLFAPRLRSGEHDHLLTVLKVVDLKPQLFESLADNDEGMDPNTFETTLLRERIEKHRLLGELAAELAPLSDQVGDTSLYLASLFREALSAAYRIAKTHAQTDKKINDVLAPVIDFMRKASVAAAAKRAKKQPE